MDLQIYPEEGNKLNRGGKKTLNSNIFNAFKHFLRTKIAVKSHVQSDLTAHLRFETRITAPITFLANLFCNNEAFCMFVKLVISQTQADKLVGTFMTQVKLKAWGPHAARQVIVYGPRELKTHL